MNPTTLNAAALWALSLSVAANAAGTEEASCTSYSHYHSSATGSSLSQPGRGSSSLPDGQEHVCDQGLFRRTTQGAPVRLPKLDGEHVASVRISDPTVTRVAFGTAMPQTENILEVPGAENNRDAEGGCLGDGGLCTSSQGVVGNPVRVATEHHPSTGRKWRALWPGLGRAKRESNLDSGTLPPTSSRRATASDPAPPGVGTPPAKGAAEGVQSTPVGVSPSSTRPFSSLAVPPQQPASSGQARVDPSVILPSSLVQSGGDRAGELQAPRAQGRTGQDSTAFEHGSHVNTGHDNPMELHVDASNGGDAGSEGFNPEYGTEGGRVYSWLDSVV